MKRLKPFRSTYVAIAIASASIAYAPVALGQAIHTGDSAAPAVGQRTPFTDIHAEMPAAVTKKAFPKGRATVVSQTLDLTANTPLVADTNPYGSKDEQTIVFQSNRGDIAGATVAADGKTHIYTMPFGGGSATAITGPLSTSGVGADTSQSYPTFDDTKYNVAYVDTDSTGAVDLIELNLTTNTPNPILSRSTDFQFADVQHPRYCTTSFGYDIVFAGKLIGSNHYSLFAADPLTKRVYQMTTGASDDRNPAISPDGKLIAFDSNRANPGQPQRDVWVMGTNPTSVPKRVTNYLTSSNVEPAWSSAKQDPYGLIPVPMLMFASTRMDSKGDGNYDTPINPNGSHDLYRLLVQIVPDPASPSLETLVNPNKPSTPTVEDQSTNASIKMNTSDPQHIYDDRNPNWPQQSATYRAVYESDRTSFDPSVPPDQSASGAAGQPQDIFASQMLDLDAPTLVRWSDATGEIVHVDPRQALAGRPVTISVKVADFESGIRDVYIQIKNPNSKYQSLDNLEHKVFQFYSVTPDNTHWMTAPLEWESEPIDPTTDTYPRTNITRATAPEYFAGFDDANPFAGTGIPDSQARWIKLGNPTRDPATGYWTYSTTWTTPTTPSDYIIDVIAFDKAVDPFAHNSADAGSNWKIYDNVWGFSTLPFARRNSILYVSDYTQGQKFFNSRFGTASPISIQGFWGCESWLTDIDWHYLPTAYATHATTPENGAVDNALNAMGVDSYGAGVWHDQLALDGTMVDGKPYPVTQRYDIWRIICRGPVPDYVLSQYLPTYTTQPATTAGGTPRKVLVSNGCVIWHAPYTGDVFPGPGTLTDTATQTQLDAYLNAGGRLFVDGQDVAWALSQNGTEANSFLTNDLKASFVADWPGGVTGFLWVALGSAGPRPVYESTYNSYYKLSAAQGSKNDPISGDPWLLPWSIGQFGHIYPYIQAANPGPGVVYVTPDYIYQETELAPGLVNVATPDYRTYGDIGGAELADVVNAAPDATVDLAYGGTTNPVLMHYPSLAVEAAADFNTEPLGGRRVVFSPTGIEGLNPGISSLGSPELYSILKNRIAEIMHNIVCWFRTGSFSGSVRTVEGGDPLPNALVMADDNSGRVAYTALTDKDGNFVMNGVRPGGYGLTAEVGGFAFQHGQALEAVHGVTTTSGIDLLMTPVSPASVSGTVYQSDGKTPVAGATLTLQDNVSSTNKLTATSGTDGTYSFERVAAGTTYTLTCAGTGFGQSTPTSYQVPNPNDPIIAQRDTQVVGGKSYVGFDFDVAPLPGGASGQVAVANPTNDPQYPADGTGISGATITATMGSSTVTAVADDKGNYSFSASNTPANGLNPGTWGLVATAPGYLPNTPVSVTITGGQDSTVPTIKLQPAPPGSLSGLVTRGADGVALAGVTMSITDANGKALPGVPNVTTGPVQTSGSYSYNYKFPSVPAGATVLVTATLNGYKASFGTSNPQSAAVVSGQETQGVNFKLDAMFTFPIGTSLISAPYDYPSTDVATLLGVSGTGLSGFGFFWWDPTAVTYRAYPDPAASRLKVGEGFFLRSTKPLPLTAAGNAAARDQVYPIALKAGWNAIGNPFPLDDTGAGINIDWTKVPVQTVSATLLHDQAVSQGVIASGIYSYVLSTPILDYSINTWKGYFVRAYQDCTLLLDPVNGQLGKAAASRAIDSTLLQGGSGWTVNVQAHSANDKDETNYLGVASGATDGFDGFKVEKPPIFGPEYVRVGLDHADWGARSGSYGVDVRSAASPSQTWKLSVGSNGVKGPITLSWPGAARVGRNWTLKLTDLATNTVRDMRSSSGYTWQSSGGAEVRNFQVTASATRRSAILVISDVVAQQPSRAAGINLGYSLSVPADVQLRILGSGGKVVRNLATQVGRAAGAGEATWDGRNNQGVVVPAGMYQIEIRAQTSDGQVARQIAPVVITR